MRILARAAAPTRRRQRRKQRSSCMPGHGDQLPCSDGGQAKAQATQPTLAGGRSARGGSSDGADALRHNLGASHGDVRHRSAGEKSSQPGDHVEAACGAAVPGRAQAGGELPAQVRHHQHGSRHAHVRPDRSRPRAAQAADTIRPLLHHALPQREGAGPGARARDVDADDGRSALGLRAPRHLRQRPLQRGHHGCLGAAGDVLGPWHLDLGLRSGLRGAEAEGRLHAGPRPRDAVAHRQGVRPAGNQHGHLRHDAPRHPRRPADEDHH
mmetsp:Transcript_110930/g.353690  ORF Transcript_110930/g.353690 Transcript_110930/m.353690 type:complete len:268 (+) Transcript_110930:318-1121(+)